MRTHGGPRSGWLAMAGLLLFFLACPVARAETPPDLLDGGDDELLSEPVAAAPTMTVLLDVNPVDIDEDYEIPAYDAILETLRNAEDLGDIRAGRELMPRDQLHAHVVRTCQMIDNVACIARFARETKATYAVYGELKDLDDIYLIELALMSVADGEAVHSVRLPIPKPAKQAAVAGYAARAACKLTRRFGCEDDEAVATQTTAAPLVAPLAAPVAASQTQAPPPPIEDAEESMGGEADDEEIADEPLRDAPTESQPASDGQTLRTAGWVMIGVSAAALVGGVISTGLMFKYNNDSHDAASRGDTNAYSLYDTSNTLRWTAIGLFAVSAATAAAGVPRLVIGYDRAGEASAQILPAAGPDGGGLVLVGRF